MANETIDASLCSIEARANQVNQQIIAQKGEGALRVERLENTVFLKVKTQFLKSDEPKQIVTSQYDLLVFEIDELCRRWHNNLEGQ